MKYVRLNEKLNKINESFGHEEYNLSDNELDILLNRMEDIIKRNKKDYDKYAGYEINYSVELNLTFNGKLKFSSKLAQELRDVFIDLSVDFAISITADEIIYDDEKYDSFDYVNIVCKTYTIRDTTIYGFPVDNLSVSASEMVISNIRNEKLTGLTGQIYIDDNGKLIIKDCKSLKEIDLVYDMDDMFNKLIIDVYNCPELSEIILPNSVKAKLGKTDKNVKLSYK